MHVIVDVHITPIGTPTTSLSTYIAAAESVLKRYPHIKSQLNPMTTTLEGELDEILRAIQDMHAAPFDAGATRVSTTLRIDERRDGHQATMADRVQSVQGKIQ